MRRRDPLSPEELRELDAIDRALAGEPVDHDLRELEQLVSEVRATAPQMSPALTARLERMVEHGPQPAAEQEAVKPRRPKRWVLVPALGTVAAAVVALVVVLGNGDERSNSLSQVEVAKDAPAVAAPESGDSALTRKSAPSTAGRRAAAPPPTTGRTGSGSGPIITPQRRRRVERSAFLVLETPGNKFDSTVDDVVQTVDRFRGIVASSSDASDDRSGGQATFDLRIPTSRVDDALAALSKLGHVAQRRQDLQDITASFSSAQERLDEARAERRGLLKSLGNATTRNQVQSIRSRLRLVAGQIASAKGQLASLRRRASYSRVSVNVRGTGKTEQGGGSWSPGDAANDALRVLEVVVGIALIALAVLIPLALLGAALIFAARVARSRRRESALDAT